MLDFFPKCFTFSIRIRKHWVYGSTLTHVCQTDKDNDWAMYLADKLWWFNHVFKSHHVLKRHAGFLPWQASSSDHASTAWLLASCFPQLPVGLVVRSPLLALETINENQVSFVVILNGDVANFATTLIRYSTPEWLEKLPEECVNGNSMLTEAFSNGPPCETCMGSSQFYKACLRI